MTIMRRLLPFILILLLTVSAAAAQTPTPSPDVTPEATAEATAEAVEVEILLPEVVATYPHDPTAYTQGLLLHDGVLYESTGQYGESDLRRVEIETGEVLQRVPVSANYFAEGLALVDDRLIQLTWQSGVAFVYDRETFEPIEQFEYDTEGWGLCYDDAVLWMSDGTDNLYQRDPQTFQLLEMTPVTLNGSPVALLNELECVGEVIYANIYLRDLIVRIDKATGQVTGIIDASSLLTLEERAPLARGEVLNGIAYNAEAETFYLTGKHWPRLFEVTFRVIGTLEQ